MKRSIALAGLMVLAAASSAAAQGRPAQPGRTPVTTNACPAGAYSVIQAPDGSSVSVLFHAFTVESEGGPARTLRTTCRIEIPMALPAGHSAGLTSVDYRGFALLGQRQSAQLDVSYEVGRGNRAPRFQRRLQGRQEGDFTFTDRLPPGQLRRAGCGGGGAPVLAIDAALTLTTAGQTSAAMVSLDSADQSTGALRYRFNVQPCALRPERLSDVDALTSE